MVTKEFAFVDCNHDGSVGSADLDMVRANWGDAPACAVPEPSGTFLFLAAVVVIVSRRKKGVGSLS